MMIEGNSEIKNVFAADVEGSLWKSPHRLKNEQQSGRKQECTFTGTPCYAWEKMHDPEDSIKRWNDQVSTLKMCLTLTEI